MTDVNRESGPRPFMPGDPHVGQYRADGVLLGCSCGWEGADIQRHIHDVEIRAEWEGEQLAAMREAGFRD